MRPFQSVYASEQPGLTGSTSNSQLLSCQSSLHMGLGLRLTLPGEMAKRERLEWGFGSGERKGQNPEAQNKLEYPEFHAGRGQVLQRMFLYYP